MDRQAALAPIGMSFVLGFVLAGSYRNELENLLSVSLEHPSDVIEFTDMSRMARARGDQLIEKLLGTALSNLSVLDNQTVEIGLVMEEAANACELGLRAGLVLRAVDPAIDEEFREVTKELNVHPGDEVLDRIIRDLLKQYEGRLENDETTENVITDKTNKQSAELERLSKAVKDTLAFLTVKGGVSPFEFSDGAYHTHQLAKELAYLFLQQRNSLGETKEGELNVSAFVTLVFAIFQTESWLALWDTLPPKHPNIVVSDDVDHDFQSLFKNSLPMYNTEELQKYISKTNNYQEAIIAEAKALAEGYRTYVDIESKQTTNQ